MSIHDMALASLLLAVAQFIGFFMPAPATWATAGSNTDPAIMGLIGAPEHDMTGRQLINGVVPKSGFNAERAPILAMM